jgi:hypothetical protein
MARGFIKTVGDYQIHEVFNGTNNVFVAINAKSSNEFSFSGRIAFHSVAALEVAVKGISIITEKKLGKKKFGKTIIEIE